MDQQDAFWYVARIKSGETERALRSLRSASINHLHPTGRHLDGTEYPLIPGYLFVLLPPDEESWSMVTEARGIDHLLPAGHEVPSAIRSVHMDVFFEQVVRGDFVEHAADAPLLPWFNRGESVGITTGPFSNHVGKFVRVHKGAVLLKVPFLGAILEVAFQGHQVLKLN